MRKLPTLAATRAFEAAARLGSVQSAADEMRVTASAVSHQTRKLEDEFGVELFHRAHRSIILTDVGRRYAEEIGEALGQIEAATRRIGRADPTDILSIHVVPSLAAQWLMQRMSRFGEANPETDVRLHASNVPVDLATGTVDVAIRYGSCMQESGTVVIPFPPETIIPVCAPYLLQGSNGIRDESDLPNHALIHSEMNLYGWKDWMRDHPGIVLNLDRGPRFDRSFMSISAAVDGRGVCLESRLLVQRELDVGTLAAPFGLDGAKRVCHSLVYLASKSRLPKVARFRQWIFEALEATLAPTGSEVQSGSNGPQRRQASL